MSKIMCIQLQAGDIGLHFNITDYQKWAEIMLQERQQSCCVAVKNTLYTINSKRDNLRKYAHYASTCILKESHVPYCRRDVL